MNRNDAIAYLTRCADDNGTHWYQGSAWTDVETCPTCHGTNDAGWLAAPCSRYGRTSADIAPFVYRVARIDGIANEHNLDYFMGLCVNDSESPQEIFREYVVGLVGADVDAIVKGYLDCQLWAQLDYDNPSCDCHASDPQNACHNYNLDKRYGLDDISADYVDRITGEIADIVVAHPLAVRMYLARLQRHGRSGDGMSSAAANEQFGHDYYLTREGHGAGFWDRGLGELGQYLTNVSKWAGAADDLSDDGNGGLAADDLLTAYEDGYSEGYWHEVERAVRYHLEGVEE